MNLVQEILKNKKPIRQILEDAVSEIDNTQNNPAAPDQQTDSDVAIVPVEPENYKHLFVRRWHENEDAPYKKIKLNSAFEALNLYFDWLTRYKQDKVEIWSDTANDVKQFYRFCLKNRDIVEPLWKQSPRTRSTGITWPSAYKDIQTRSRQSATNSIGTLFPFVIDPK